jgi:hypothetical protein
LEQDPLGFAGGTDNLYCYVANGPVNHTDPSGEVLWLAGWDSDKVWNALSRDEQRQWETLANEGWKIATGTSGNTVYVSKSLINISGYIDVDVKDSEWIALLKSGGDVQWKNGEWGVDFDNQVIYIDANRSTTAAATLKMIMGLLANKKNGKEFQTTMWGNLALGQSVVGVEEALQCENLTWKQKRVLLQLYRLDWTQAIAVVKALKGLYGEQGVELLSLKTIIGYLSEAKDIKDNAARLEELRKVLESK